MEFVRDVNEHEFLTLPETYMAPENQWLEDEFPVGKAYFQGQTVSFREGNAEICIQTGLQLPTCTSEVLEFEGSFLGQKS